MQEPPHRIYDDGNANISAAFNDREQNEGMFDVGEYQPDPRYAQRLLESSSELRH